MRRVAFAIHSWSWQGIAQLFLLFAIAFLFAAHWIVETPVHRYSVDQVPEYLQEAFILTGYRANLSLTTCLVSIFHLHNETFNIWTHLVSASAFWALSWSYYWKNQDERMIPLFCASQAAAFTGSFVAHTFSPATTTEYGYQLLWRLDWSMICVTVFCTSTTLVYFAFYQNDKRCQCWIRAFACSAAFMFLSVNMPVFTRLPPGLKVISTLVPVPCSLSFLWQVSRTLPKGDVARLFGDIRGPLLLVIAGLIVYGTQMPERLFPGWFDYIGNSHSIHHIWTTSYAIWMLRVALGWLEWRSSCEPPVNSQSLVCSAKASSALEYA